MALSQNPIESLVVKAVNKIAGNDEQSIKSAELLEDIIGTNHSVRNRIRDLLETYLFQRSDSTRYDVCVSLIEKIDIANREGGMKAVSPASSVLRSAQRSATGTLDIESGMSPSKIRPAESKARDLNFETLVATLRANLDAEIKARTQAQQWNATLETELSELKARFEGSVKERSVAETFQKEARGEAESLRAALRNEKEVVVRMNEELSVLRASFEQAVAKAEDMEVSATAFFKALCGRQRARRRSDDIRTCFFAWKEYWARLRTLHRKFASCRSSRSRRLLSFWFLLWKSQRHLRRHFYARINSMVQARERLLLSGALAVWKGALHDTRWGRAFACSLAGLKAKQSLMASFHLWRVDTLKHRHFAVLEEIQREGERRRQKENETISTFVNFEKACFVLDFRKMCRSFKAWHSIAVRRSFNDGSSDLSKLDLLKVPGKDLKEQGIKQTKNSRSEQAPVVTVSAPPAQDNSSRSQDRRESRQERSHEASHEMHREATPPAHIRTLQPQTALAAPSGAHALSRSPERSMDGQKAVAPRQASVALAQMTVSSSSSPRSRTSESEAGRQYGYAARNRKVKSEQQTVSRDSTGHKP